jgi:putative FmdB family regulatory protein
MPICVQVHRLRLCQGRAAKISDAPLTVCPSCGQPRFAKQVTAAGFQLKGSGWYVTDFRNEGSAPAADGKAAGNEGGTGAAPAPAAEAPAVAAPSPAPAPAPAPPRRPAARPPPDTRAARP